MYEKLALLLTILRWLKEKWGGRKVIFSGGYNNKNDRLINTMERYGVSIKSEEKGNLLMEAMTDAIDYPGVMDIVGETR